MSKTYYNGEMNGYETRLVKYIGDEAFIEPKNIHVKIYFKDNLYTFWDFDTEEMLPIDNYYIDYNDIIVVE